jgi:hypothetical protein
VNIFRRLSTARLLALAAAVAAIAAASGLALAFTGSAPKPPERSLANAIAHAARGTPPSGITARIRLTNHLFPAGSLGASGPLVSTASGRLWLSDDGRLRVELQSDVGDAQFLLDRKALTISQPGATNVLRIPLPEGRHEAGRSESHSIRPPALADIQQLLARVRRDATLSAAIPGSIAGRPAYAVRVSPRHDGGLLGALALGFDADRPVPLRVAVYSRGDSSPVLELVATEIHYGPVPASVFSLARPAGTKVTTVSPPTGAPEGGASGRRAVARAVDFPLHAPSTLVGLPLRTVREVRGHGPSGALVVYGQGLGSIVVLERPAGSAPALGRFLPAVSIDGASGHELATPLGTIVSWSRGDVSYTLAGSLPAVAAEAAAREISR